MFNGIKRDFCCKIVCDMLSFNFNTFCLDNFKEKFLGYMDVNGKSGDVYYMYLLDSDRLLIDQFVFIYSKDSSDDIIKVLVQKISKSSLESKLKPSGVFYIYISSLTYNYLDFLVINNNNSSNCKKKK
jgi:hypothetical protein